MRCMIKDRKLIVPEGTTRIGLHDIKEYYEENTIDEIVLPDTLQVIECDAFFDFSDFKRINIPSGVREIGAQAFWGLDALEELIISDSVSYIGKHAFCNCPKLKLMIKGDRHAVPCGWDAEFTANIGGVFFIE